MPPRRQRAALAPEPTVMLRTTSAPAIKTLLEIIKDLQTRINVTFNAEGMSLSVSFTVACRAWL